MKTYLFANVSSDDENIEIPTSLYLEISDELIKKINFLSHKAKEMTEAGIFVYGIEVRDPGVHASNLFSNKYGGAITRY